MQTRPIVAFATVGVLALAGCSSEQPSLTSPAPDPSGSPRPSLTVLGTGSGELDAGTYVLDLDALGCGEERFPPIRITVPEGWANIDGWGVNSGEGTDHWVGITFWDVREVYAHPCQWQRRSIQPGPTVADLASVLVKRPLRDATKPVDIVVDGFHGVQLEWSVPAIGGEILRVGGRSYFDFSGCDEAPEGDHPFMSWTAGSWASARYQQGPGQVDRLWILNIGGERLVIDAMYMPTTDAADRRELWRVMESINFKT